jgi:hypothetical protein
MVDEERVAGPGLDGEGYAVTMVRPQPEHTQDEQVESALEQGFAGRGDI